VTRLAVLACLALAACASGSETPPREVGRADAERAQAVEASIATNYTRRAPKGAPWFEVAEGRSRVLVVAAHATAQAQNGTSKLKSAEVGSGALALLLHDVCDVTSIRTTFVSPSDPQVTGDDAFKARLAELIERTKPALVLDLHTSKSERPFDVDIGTDHGASLLGKIDLPELLEAVFLAEGLTNPSRDFFSDDGDHAVTKCAVDRGVPCIRISVNGQWMASGRADNVRMSRFEQLLTALVAFIRYVER
jgi:hypothetical protein